ncbi:hypothetical protein B0H21DRAFT_729645 [Amylocystis lapponica]|nr:hypothetical protein B0H21DRAFT_729645 [Amylocystis lapponica]
MAVQHPLILELWRLLSNPTLSNGHSFTVVLVQLTNTTTVFAKSRPLLRTVQSADSGTSLEVLDLPLAKLTVEDDAIIKDAGEQWISSHLSVLGTKPAQILPLLLDAAGKVIFAPDPAQDLIDLVTEGKETPACGDLLRYVFCGPTDSYDGTPVLECRDYFKMQLAHTSPVVWILDSHVDAPRYTSIGMNHGTPLAAILFRPTVSHEQAINQLDKLFAERSVAAPLTSAPFASKRTLLWVHLGATYDLRKPHFSSAAALDLRLVIAEKPGHWITDPAKVGMPAREWPFALLSVDLDDAPALVENLVAAARKWEAETGIHIDGIVTIADDLLPTVCTVAAQLGLPTCGTVDAYLNCVDKFRMRQLLPWKGRPAYCVRSKADIDAVVASGLEFPVIIKPQSGGGSLGVYKIIGAADLYVLWDDVLAASHGGSALIEPFVEGMEVDVNLIMENGGLLSYEVNDNGPTPGDSSDDGAASERTFFESAMIGPSVLSPAIQERLRDATLAAVRTVGFEHGTGIFHCEARVHPSGGVFLIEINARVVGGTWPVLVRWLWGVDEPAVGFLAALGRPLARPARMFRTPAGHASLVAVRRARGGVLANDPFERVRGREDVLAVVAFPPGFAIAETGAAAGFLGQYTIVSAVSAEDRERRIAEADMSIVPRFVGQE